jgi:hypothetical protein
VILERKEVIIVTYEKPQIAFLGSASTVIQGCGSKKPSCSDDGTGDDTHSSGSAYDLDE